MSQNLAKSFWAILVLAIGLQGCSQNQASKENQNLENLQGLRPLNQTEALSDYEEMVGLFRELYGPLEYKEELLKFNFEEWVSLQREKVTKAKTEREVFAAFAEFAAKFEDGHVSIRFPLNETGFNSYSIPLTVAPMEGKFILTAIGETLPEERRYKIGDEVVAMDGEALASYLPRILKYEALATPESNLYWIHRAFNRSFFMLDILPQGPTARITFKNKDGQEWTEHFVWRPTRTENTKVDFIEPGKMEAGKSFFVHASLEAGIQHWGKSTPFFATKEVEKEFSWLKVQANEEFRKKYDLKEDQKPDIFAAMYRFEGKNILLVRNYTYYHQDLPNSVYMNGYRAILDQWQPLADVLVLDQTHNTGGSYCADFARLFLQNEGGSFVQALNTDRKWIFDLQSSWIQGITNANKSTEAAPEEILKYRLMGKTVEEAYDRGERLTTPQPIMDGNMRLLPDSKFVWKKPMLVLVDELAGSCGDAFPMLIKNNSISKIFGKRTMGLGGNVEAFTLRNSRTQLRLTRGLFTSHKDSGIYTAQDWIENNGVTPDIPYDHTIEDFRNGFVDYVKTFSKSALEQIK